MTWVRIDDEFGEHPKIAALSSPAFRAHVLALCYCNRNLTDGYIPLSVAKMLTGSARRLTELVEGELWERDENGGYQIHDYLEYNPPREWVEDQRKKRSDAGKKGAMARWQTP